MNIIRWISVVIFGITFLISLFLLCKNESNNDENKNCYGVVKSTGTDTLYKKLSIAMIIVGIVTALGCIVGSYLDSYDLAKFYYEHYNAEDRLDIAQSYLDRAQYLLNQGNIVGFHDVSSIAEQYISPGDSPMAYMHWGIDDVSVNFESVIPFCGIALLGILFPLYMFPSKTARRKAHEQTKVIVWLNGLLSCTVICWIAMIIWTNSSGKENEPVRADAADRFRQLEELKLKGVITEKEYEEQKSKILQEL